MLEPEASAALRNQLVAELKALYSADEAARLANLPNFALDRLSRYESTLWRQSAGYYLRLMHRNVVNPKKEDDVRQRQRIVLPELVLSTFEAKIELKDQIGTSHPGK
jgi:hypothetical protein